MTDERLVYGSSDQMTVLLHNEINPCDPSAALESLLIPNSSPSFHGEFGTENSSFFEPVEKDATNDDDFDGFWRQPGKKRRLSVDQVQFLEKNFEVENKLEPERKIQLAKELGLQPRQVAIWFQNRRARYKTKQLEKDFSSLRNIHDKLKSDYDSLIKEKENLQVEVNTLKEKLAIREKAKQNSSSNTEGSEKVSSSTPMAVCKQEEASSTKSVVFDSDSPHNLENHSSMAEPGDSNSNGFEPDQSDFSQDEEDNLSRNLLPACFPKLEGCYYDEHQIIEDPPLGFWLF